MSAHITFAAGYGNPWGDSRYSPLPVFQPNGQLTLGLPPIFVDTRLCDECSSVHDFEKCPLCGSWIDVSYGFVFGGLGTYYVCQRLLCPWFFKRFDSGE